VTAAIIGPRTMEHLESQLAAAEVDLPGVRPDQADPRASRARQPAECSGSRTGTTSRPSILSKPAGLQV